MRHREWLTVALLIWAPWIGYENLFRRYQSLGHDWRMPSPASFDAMAATRALQEAVRTHNAQELDELISERFVFASARSITRLGESGFLDSSGKAEWLAAADSIDWQSFAIHQVRCVNLRDTAIVDCRLSQVVRRDATDTETSWVVTDVWTVEGAAWRLVVRHPELVVET